MDDLKLAGSWLAFDAVGAGLALEDGGLHIPHQKLASPGHQGNPVFILMALLRPKPFCLESGYDVLFLALNQASGDQPPTGPESRRQGWSHTQDHGSQDVDQHQVKLPCLQGYQLLPHGKVHGHRCAPRQGAVLHVYLSRDIIQGHVILRDSDSRPVRF
jgi:hypothetical protein